MVSVVRCGYHLRIFCEKKLPSDSILLAWLIRHAAWCLTRIQVKDDGRTAFVRVLGKAYTSQVLQFGERVMYKYTSVPTGNLDQRWGHGIWVGKAPVTYEDVILTENGVLRARSLHRVPPEERFVISELKNVRGLPWNGRAENLGATVVTQQDQGPSGHRRVYVTTRVVARHGATPGCSGCVGLGPHTEAFRVRLEKALADERADSVGTPVGPITEPTSESHEPAPAAQQEPASSSSSPAASMPTQNLQSEQMDSPMELGPQERTERKGARPSETPTRETSGRPVVKARPALSPMIVPTAEGSGTVVLSTPASSSKDETTIGGLYVIDGIDVVATLVPEKDVWQFEAAETCTTETQMQTESKNQLRLWTTRIPARRKPLRLTTQEQVKSSIQKKCETDEPKRCENLMNSKSKWSSMSQKCD